MILITVIVFIIMALLVPIIIWGINLYTDEPYIKFDQFLELYNKDPSKLVLGYNHIEFKRYFSNQYFNFKLIDYYMYKYWKRKLNKSQKEEKLKVIYDEIFKEINKDENT